MADKLTISVLEVKERQPIGDKGALVFVAALSLICSPLNLSMVSKVYDVLHLPYVPLHLPHDFIKHIGRLRRLF